MCCIYLQGNYHKTIEEIDEDCLGNNLNLMALTVQFLYLSL